METTLIILKPDAVQRGLMGRILSRFEDKGLQIVGTKLTMIIAGARRQALRGPRGEAVLQRARSVHDKLPVLVLAIRGNRRDRDLPHDDGCDLRLEGRRPARSEATSASRTAST